jgi:hypothetical protein
MNPLPGRRTPDQLFQLHRDHAGRLLRHFPFTNPRGSGISSRKCRFLEYERYDDGVLITDEEPKHSDRPRFDKRSIFAGLIIWAFALLLLLLIYVHEARHPAIPGEKDLGEGILVMTGLLAASIVFLGGTMSMFLGLVHFIWLRWRFSRSTSSGAERS